MARVLPKHLVLLLLLGLCPAVRSTAPLHIFVTYQSYQNSLSQFFTMFTLCLAPLVLHIAVGVPKVVIFADEPPSWIEKVTHFNPISIVWRYYAIAYRRLRATKWDAADMAACNALIWDGECWDGSEAMMVRSREYLPTPPESAHTSLVSGSSLSTLTLTLQGIQAIITVIVIMTNPFTSDVLQPANFTFPVDLPGLFLPLGVLGLLRLPAACWISNDFGYSWESNHESLLSSCEVTESEMLVGRLAISCRLVDTRNWKSILYRIWWIATLVAIMGPGLYDVCSQNPQAVVVNMTLTEFSYVLMYGLLCAGFLIIHTVYVLMDGHIPTVIPCSQSIWYKALTFLMAATAAFAVAVASIETVQLPNGQYITGPLLNCTIDGNCQPIDKTLILQYVESEWESFLGSYGTS